MARPSVVARISGKLRRVAGSLAVLCIALVVLLQGRPDFTNAARPPRGISDPAVAIQVVHNIEEVDDILGEAPSPDREVMRFKQYIDFAFIAAYAALFLILAALLLREEDWRRAAGMAAAICAIGTAVFDVLENITILRVLDVPLHLTTASMINSIRSASAAKWALAAITLSLLSILFLGSNGWLARVIGGLFILSAAMICYGFHDNRLFMYEGYPALAGLAGIGGIFFRLR